MAARSGARDGDQGPDADDPRGPSATGEHPRGGRNGLRDIRDEDGHEDRGTRSAAAHQREPQDDRFGNPIEHGAKQDRQPAAAVGRVRTRHPLDHLVADVVRQGARHEPDCDREPCRRHADGLLDEVVGKRADEGTAAEADEEHEGLTLEPPGEGDERADDQRGRGQERPERCSSHLSPRSGGRCEDARNRHHPRSSRRSHRPDPPFVVARIAGSSYRTGMCRSIKTLRRADEAATTGELEAAARQYVRKISGYRVPSARNSEAFEARDRRDRRRLDQAHGDPRRRRRGRAESLDATRGVRGQRPGPRPRPPARVTDRALVGPAGSRHRR